ncbi:ubiquinol oxidase mitochondrial [Phtheirospermum japonicum]|uniref:Ubiquinol oxidase mitochondrial n=1 Tax=Phtheirospermum japonicum TaxID=374723 RepID=A0A830CNM9_9LAMI|nr:ubiquinol oxidase mitochondrial [Phtheirospermum japonicum]
MTIFYAGQVIVIDHFPDGKAKEVIWDNQYDLMTLLALKKGSHDLNRGIRESLKKDGKSSSMAAKKVEKGDVVVSSYWGISKPKIIREDGTEWPWNYFMPWETYRADLSIDLGKRQFSKTFIDKVAYRTVKLLRFPTIVFFQKQYGCRAVMLETVGTKLLMVFAYKNGRIFTFKYFGCGGTLVAGVVAGAAFGVGTRIWKQVDVTTGLFLYVCPICKELYICLMQIRMGEQANYS